MRLPLPPGSTWVSGSGRESTRPTARSPAPRTRQAASLACCWRHAGGGVLTRPVACAGARVGGGLEWELMSRVPWSQAVVWKNTMLVFGGEFTSPNQERFHHYKARHGP
jgi:hypothetical protein